MTTPIQIKNIILGEGIPKICVPLTAASREMLMEEAKAAVSAGADLAEWRADFFEDLLDKEKITEMVNILSDILGSIPLLFTIRTREEGGQCRISMEDYESLNQAAARSGKVDLIDVEVFRQKDGSALIEALHKADHKIKVIASSHDFEKTEDEETLLERFRSMDATGADILKIAVMPQEPEDVEAIMKATSRMAGELTQKPLISMSMGSMGSITRIAGENFGSCVTFGTVGAASAPGQFPIDKLRAMLLALHRENQKSDNS